MTDAWNMTGGKVYVAPVGADPKDPSRWHQLGTLTEMEMRQDDGWYGDGRTTTLTTQGPLTLFKPEPVKTLASVEFTFNTKPFSLDALALYYGTDVKAAGIVNNRGETRKEEKHMGVRKFKSQYDKDIEVKGFGAGVQLDVKATHGVLLKHADVPLIAHALFEKSGWPTAEEDPVGDWEAETPAGSSTWGFKVRSDEEAAGRLLDIIANLAAYNAWHEGKAKREAAEAAKKKREHDELRSSPIALEALKLYNDYVGGYGIAPYSSWDGVNRGMGTGDAEVRTWIAEAEAARAAKPAPKLGDRVRVSADAKTVMGGAVCFGKEVEGIVIENEVRHQRGDILVLTDDFNQYVDPKYVTVVATAEDLAAEKAKAERDAGIAAILKADDVIITCDAARLYDRGIRATA